jgi:hypothetical protein
LTQVHGRKRIEVTTAAIVTISVIIAIFGMVFLGTSKTARAGETGTPEASALGLPLAFSGCHPGPAANKP